MTDIVTSSFKVKTFSLEKNAYTESIKRSLSIVFWGWGLSLWGCQHTESGNADNTQYCRPEKDGTNPVADGIEIKFFLHGGSPVNAVLTKS